MPEKSSAEIVDAPIVVEALIDRVRTDACGAVVTFIGVVREVSDDERAVDGLAYEVYPQMALPEMEAIVRETRERFGPCEIAIMHRIGELGLGEASVVIVVAAPHRGPAFDACEYAIDELKARVPIWKKERYRDGEATWRSNAGTAPA